VFIERMHDRGSLDYALTTGLTLIVTAGYVLSLSTLASCTSSNPRQGLVRAYVLMLCVLWVFPLTLGFVFTTLYLYRPPDWVDHIACLSPYLSQALNFQQNRYAMLNLHWAVNAGTFVVVAYVLYRVALFRFRRRYYFGAPYPTTLHSGKSAVHAVQEAVASARMTERHYD
jgi:ABC-type transport system involved in multi-copper enzyme maturation permease subunit